MLALAVAAVLLLAGVAPALAQGYDPGIVKVPFKFVVGGRVLPAGTYVITRNSSDGMLLVIQSLKGKTNAVLFPTEPLTPLASQVANIHVEFKPYRGQYFLWKVTMPEQGVREVALTAPEMDRQLAKLNLAPMEPALGASAK